MSYKIMAVQVVPYEYHNGGSDTLVQFDGPTKTTVGWSVYLRELSGEAKWVADLPTEQDAEFVGQCYAKHHRVEIEPQAWKSDFGTKLGEIVEIATKIAKRTYNPSGKSWSPSEATIAILNYTREVMAGYGSNQPVLYRVDPKICAYSQSPTSPKVVQLQIIGTEGDLKDSVLNTILLAVNPDTKTYTGVYYLDGHVLKK